VDSLVLKGNEGELFIKEGRGGERVLQASDLERFIREKCMKNICSGFSSSLVSYGVKGNSKMTDSCTGSGKSSLLFRGDTWDAIS